MANALVRAVCVSCLGLAMAAPGWAQTEEVPEPMPESEGVRFTCQIHDGVPTVMYSPQSQPGQFYPWAVPQDLGSAWPAQRRCDEISRRLEEYRPDGLLELQTAVENGYDIVCVTTEAVPGCRIVFTVPPGQDAIATRDSVFQNIAIADSGETTQGVVTFTEGGSVLPEALQNVLGGGTATPRQSINLRPFLDPADGGTGAQLSSPAQLNPESFR